MKAPTILEDLGRRGVILRADGEGLAYDAPRGELTNVDLAVLRENKAGLLDYLSSSRPPDWEALASMRWADDPAPGIVVDLPVTSQASATPRGGVTDPVRPGPIPTTDEVETRPRRRNYTAPDCPAWVFNSSFVVSLEQIEASVEAEREAAENRAHRASRSKKL